MTSQEFSQKKADHDTTVTRNLADVGSTVRSVVFKWNAEKYCCEVTRLGNISRNATSCCYKEIKRQLRYRCAMCAVWRGNRSNRSSLSKGFTMASAWIDEEREPSTSSTNPGRSIPEASRWKEAASDKAWDSPLPPPPVRPTP
eukprot:3702605-Amphidinium_carterae.3